MSATTGQYTEELDKVWTERLEDDELRPAKGIMTAMVLGLPIWAGLIWVVRAILS